MTAAQTVGETIHAEVVKEDDIWSTTEKLRRFAAEEEKTCVCLRFKRWEGSVVEYHVGTIIDRGSGEVLERED